MREVIGRSIEQPVMVKLALWPNMSRSAVWAFFWVSVALAVGSVFYGFYWGGLLFFSALWYWLAIRWMDQHRAW